MSRRWKPGNQASFGVQRRAIESATKPVIIELPDPPTTNNLFANFSGHGRIPTERYSKWKRAAHAMLMIARPKRVPGRVHISMLHNDTRKADLDNLAKAPLDALVEWGVIDGDGPAFVRSILLTWGTVTGVRITIRPHEEET
jgi:Holliday junction resolvase RusA-like endonuclease